MRETAFDHPEPRLWRDVRRWTAGVLDRMARWVYVGDHREVIEIHDEFDVCRCRIAVASDEYAHGVDSASDRLPSDWAMQWFVDGQRWQ